MRQGSGGRNFSSGVWYARFGSALCGGSPHRAYLEQLGMKPELIFDRYDVVDNERFWQAAEAARANPEPFRAIARAGLHHWTNLIF